MNRKTVIILGSCFLFATIFMITLYATTRTIVHERNSFIREYAKFAAVQSSEMDIGLNSWYIAGITEDHVYLGNVTAPFNVLATNSTLTDSQHVKLSIKNLQNPKVYKSALLKIDSPYFYLADGVKPALYRGLLGKWEAEFFPYDSGAYFSRLVPISKSSFGIRTVETRSSDNILGKVQMNSPRIQLKNGLLQKQVDGIFCTDGMLHYNKDLKRLIYTYYYRNEYIVYDTNLNLDYRSHTIDTFSQARITVGYVKSNDTKTLTDRHFVNIRTCTSGKYLFVWSNLLAKNDSKDILDNSSVIDVYDLSNKTYRFSFLVPHYDNNEIKMREFMVFGSKTLIALYDHYLVKYDLQKRYF